MYILTHLQIPSHPISLQVICPLTEPEEFKKYSGMDGLLDFYREECGLITYNRAIPDFQIPVAGDLVNNILDLTYHLSQGRNCLVHCAGTYYKSDQGNLLKGHP